MPDPVTGLPHRPEFVAHLAQSVDRAVRYPGFHFGVLRIDLAAGAGDGADESPVSDAVLAVVARRLETCLRTTERPRTFRNNDLIAYFDGGRFAILLDGLKEVGHVTIVAARVLAELRVPHHAGGHEVRVSASIGIAVSTTGYDDGGDVLRDAEVALDRAMRMGGNRCETFDATALEAVHTELRLESDLAPGFDRGEFLLLYQPIVSLDGEAIVGFEALARWQHPGLGLISPADFIPIAERTGFIVPLGDWVLRRACAQIATWQRAGLARPDLWVSVNMSSVQFAHPALITEIVEILRETGLDPRCLMLELTEGVAMEDPAGVSALLSELRALGVRVSVDDFGTGHSSLAYLRQFPLDYLKIDRSFVRGIDANDDMRGIFAAVSAMAKQLGLRVIAEGIETPGQLAFVRALDAQLGQGYLLSRPVDGAAAATLLATGLPARPRENIDTTPVSTPVLSLLAGHTPSTPSQRAWLYAIAALVLVTISIGLPRALVPADRPPVSAPVATDIALKAEPPVALPPAAPRRERAVRSKGAAKAAPAPSRPSPSDASRPSAPVAPAPLRVVHQHRLGSCKGELVVTRDGLSFVPDGEGGRDDAFTLKHHEFLPVLEADGLTIRSSRRAYRFKPADATAAHDDQLQRFADSLTQFRAFP